MKFGIFDYIEARGETLQKTYEDRLALLQAADAAGFYGYHLTEHHATKAAGTLVVGSPDTVARILTAQAERIRQNYLVLMLAFGSLTHAQEMRSLELFKREIMPKLAAMNYEEASLAPALATA